MLVAIAYRGLGSHALQQLLQGTCVVDAKCALCSKVRPPGGLLAFELDVVLDGHARIGIAGTGMTPSGCEGTPAAAGQGAKKLFGLF